MAMIRRWLALTYYLYALRLAALSHFYFNRLYRVAKRQPEYPKTHQAACWANFRLRLRRIARTARWLGFGWNRITACQQHQAA